MEPNSRYPQIPSQQYNTQYAPQYPVQYTQVPQQYPQQYSQQYIHPYPQQPGMYQQMMITSPPMSQQQYAQVIEKQVYIGNAGRQEEHAVLKSGGFQKLDQQTGIFIKQKFELAELVLGCETQNRYNVYALDMDGTKKGRQIFKAKENSEFCERYCLSGDCRPFQMNINTTVRGAEDNEYEPFLLLDRPCKCTCLCFNRPEIRVMAIEGGRSEYIGKIIDPFNYCNMEMNIYDKDNNHKFTIKGSCCQLGVWCKLPCESCQTIDFEVRSASGEVVSSMQKRTPGCLQAMTTDMDSFALNFPKGCTPTDKALLMSAVLFIDYRHFETNAKDQNNNNYY